MNFVTRPSASPSCQRQYTVPATPPVLLNTVSRKPRLAWYEFLSTTLVGNVAVSGRPAASYAKLEVRNGSEGAVHGLAPPMPTLLLCGLPNES